MFFIYLINFKKRFLSFLCRDRACLHPVVWPRRDQPWAPQDMVTALCLALGCLVWWTRLARGLPPNRSSRFSSRTATSSKSFPHLAELQVEDQYLELNFIYVYCYIKTHPALSKSRSWCCDCDQRSALVCCFNPAPTHSAQDFYHCCPK